MDLRDSNGRVVGRIMESSDRVQKLYDRVGAYAGKYDPSTNRTYDKYGSYYGSGNLLAMMLSEA